MFKKLFTYTLSILLICIMLTGCNSKPTQAKIGKNLDKNLNKLYNTVTNLDTIDNNYINNPDLHINTNKSNFANKSAKINVISKNCITTKNQIMFDNETENTNDIIQKLLIKELEKRLSLNNNGYCNSCNNSYNCDNDGYCTNCGNAILCDENGNCTYCKNCLTLNDSNTCSSCNKSYLINKVNNKANQDDDKIGISDFDINNNYQEYTITPLTNVVNSEEISSENNQLSNSENTALYDVDNDVTKTNSNINELNLDVNEVANTEKIISTENSTDENETVNNDVEIDNGTDKTQTTEDNNTVPNIKFFYYTNDSFKPIKLKYNPRFITNYNENDINEQLSNYLYKVQRLYAMTEDALQANNILSTTKQQLLESIIDIRELNECIINGTCSPTIQQLQALNNYSYDIKNTVKKLKSCNGDLENEVTTINSNIPASIASSVDVMNSNYVKLINLLDTRITYHKSAIATLDQIKFLLEDAIGTENITDKEIIDIIEQLTPSESTNIDNNTDSEIEQAIIIEQQPQEDTINNNDTSNEANKEDTTHNEIVEENEDVSQQQIENNNTDNTSANEVKEVNNEKKSIKNIDTYKESISTPSENVDTTPIDNNQQIVEQGRLADENTVENGINNENTVNNNGINGNNSYVNGSYGLENNGINDGIYKNSVINQNNLNNNDGYGGYYYDNNGVIHNNGINNNNEFGNNGNTIENNINRNNNTNTYGYNTMLDIINQGTVNNGINTL